jgi:hypothetical protein
VGCNAGETLTGGGFEDLTNGQMEVIQSFREFASWKVVYFNPAPIGGAFLAYAECASLLP